ncbi:MAG TPA: ABC transporter permease [Chloroflexota bacterium]|nr:ABC transporter permease [Chloroflexota bacterium]
MALEADATATVAHRARDALQPSDAAGAASVRGLWRDAWRRLRRNRAAVAGLVFILVMACCAALADVLAPYPFWQQDLSAVRQPPSLQHPLGTDELGRDILSRLLYGARVSLAVGLVVQALILVVGVPIGALAGYFGGWLDTLLMRAVDVLYALPDLLLVIVVMSTVRAALSAGGGALGAFAAVDAAFGGLLGVFLALALTSWLTVARLVRGQVLSLKEREFVLAARAVGAGHARILRVHLLPNTLAPIIVAATFGIPSAILLEASLSFLGLGVQAPMPSWGAMILEGYKAMRAQPHMLIAPAAALSLTVLSYNFFGDGLRDALDPWMGR